MFDLQVKDGVIKNNFIYNIKLESMIIEPRGKCNVRTLKPMTPKGITIHNTANTSKGANALLHSKYLTNIEKADSKYVSWHFTVDDEMIVQHLPITEVGYHAGDGVGFGNSNTIGIEICENGDYEKAQSNAIILIIALMGELGIEVEYVRPHRYYSNYRKLCPRKILKNEKEWKSKWSSFTNTILSVKKHYENMGVSYRDKEIIYKTLSDIPKWGKDAIKHRIKIGALNGTGNGELNISQDMLRMIVSDYVLFRSIGLIEE